MGLVYTGVGCRYGVRVFGGSRRGVKFKRVRGQSARVQDIMSHTHTFTHRHTTYTHIHTQTYIYIYINHRKYMYYTSLVVSSITICYA